MVKFTLDSREKQLQALFTVNSIPFEIKQLDLGDIVINYTEIKTVENKDTEENDKQSKEEVREEHTIIIERKTRTDLAASMNDSRYREQKSRYIQLPHGTCYYIVENNDRHFSTLDKRVYLGMYIHTIIRDGIHVFLTESLEETFNLLIKLGETLDEFGLKWKSGMCSMENSQIKKKKVADKDVFKQQLCCFPGISSSKAESIVVLYPNMQSFIDAIKSNTFKVKGIGKVLLTRIKAGLNMV